jgi:hypothetical protein
MHHEVRLGGVDQATDSGLPFLEVLLGLRQFLDVIGSIAQSQQLAPSSTGSARLRAKPTAGLDRSISYYFTDVLSAEFAFSSAASAAAISGQLVTLSRAAHGARSIRRFE